MAEPQTNQWRSLGNLFMWAAFILPIGCGFLGRPPVLSIAITAILFTTGYVFVRLPHIVGLYRSDGPKTSLMFLYIPIPYVALSTILYGVGWLFS